MALNTQESLSLTSMTVKAPSPGEMERKRILASGLPVKCQATETLHGPMVTLMLENTNMIKSMVKECLPGKTAQRYTTVTGNTVCNMASAPTRRRLTETKSPEWASGKKASALNG